MDGPIVVWLNGGVGRWGLFDDLMTVAVSDYLLPVLGSLALLGLWFSGDDLRRTANQTATATGALAIGLANLLVTIVNAFVFRDRPFVDYDLTLLFYEPTDSSFPANTTAVGFAVATALFPGHRRLSAALYGLAVVSGVARVYAGVHYPSDVLAGAAVGVAGALAAAAVMRVLMPVYRSVLAVFSRAYLG